MHFSFLEQGLIFRETSAKTAQNVEEAQAEASGGFESNRAWNRWCSLTALLPTNMEADRRVLEDLLPFGGALCIARGQTVDAAGHCWKLVESSMEWVVEIPRYVYTSRWCFFQGSVHVPFSWFEHHLLGQFRVRLLVAVRRTLVLCSCFFVAKPVLKDKPRICLPFTHPFRASFFRSIATLREKGKLMPVLFNSSVGPVFLLVFVSWGPC